MAVFDATTKVIAAAIMQSGFIIAPRRTISVSPGPDQVRSELSPLDVLHVAARVDRCCCTALRRDCHGISIRAVSLLEQRLIHDIAGAPTGTVRLRKSWRGSCNHEGNPNHNFFHKFLLSVA